MAYQLAIGLSIGLFLYYGLQCLIGGAMVEEFERFGIPRYRRLTGVLEVLGAVGLFVGYFVPVFTLLASGGLALLMALGVAVRLRVRDPWVSMLPAAGLMLLNFSILLGSLGP